MSTDQKDLNIPCFIEIFSINDFARFVCALERIPLPVLKFKVNGEFILATQTDSFQNTPILYFVKTKEEGNFIMYKQKNGKETVEMSNSTKDRMGIYAPIISLKKIPRIFEDGYKSKDIKLPKYLLMMTEDLSNLCKLALYKVLYDETPLPLFFLTNNGVPLLGTFTRMDDADDTSIFFYTNLKKKPEHCFIKYSSSNPEKTDFTDNTEGHGYLYSKIIRLGEKHTLVEI